VLSLSWPCLCCQGGDTPEAQLVAVHEMASETSGLVWRANAVRVIVLTTDAPFHTGMCAGPVPAAQF
jgi:hypothetical protein